MDIWIGERRLDSFKNAVIEKEWLSIRFLRMFLASGAVFDAG